jgi:ribosomal protein S18 acetylase RimI-like enzyme
MEIRNLEQSWKGKNFLFRYTTSHHYRVDIQQEKKEIKIELKRVALPSPVEKSFESSLFSDWLINPKVLGVFEGEDLLAYLELSEESWNNRLRIANLWVKEEHRHQGIGKMLMAKAIEIAKSGGNRALVLETQSCNDPAIRFYFSCGFNLIGLDSMHYQNDDIQRGEVRLEFGLML